MKDKSDLKGNIKTLLTDLKLAGLNVRFIQYDDAGEKMTMKNDPKIKSFVIYLEFSGPRTPQKRKSRTKTPDTLWNNPINFEWIWLGSSIER
jgi:hypothetical protein